MSDDLYNMTGPTNWAGSPERFSYSSLSSIKVCPLRWQLERSQYGSYKTLPRRPTEATIVGTIVHEVLEVLLRALAHAGHPARGTDNFRKIVMQTEPLALVEAKLEAARAELVGHPRARGFRIKRTPIEIYRQAASIFQRQYRGVGEGRAPEPSDESFQSRGTIAFEPEPASQIDGPGLLAKLRDLGTISEQYIEHPTLPVRGYIDLVYLDGDRVIIGDFKTGKRYASHRDQLALYALMWWRVTGQRPYAVEVLYTDGVERHEVAEADLEAAEQSTAQAIEEARAAFSHRPAPAKLNEHCGWCDARPFCPAYWKDVGERHARGETVSDIEVIVVGERLGQGIAAETLFGKAASLVWSSNQDMLHGKHRIKTTLKLISSMPDRGAFVLQPWTEIFTARAGCGAPKRDAD